ncbi:MAG: heme A synthase [Acidiphilium sp. 37-64-53]|uniref:COX15/CtaA family protein n=1 Tax=Acidiphilium TaxID=522 RepID=UPI000BCE3C0D|nr:MULTISPECIES: COX15/CtaA family protein [Acidiphilium]OYW00782.1 MAG: heme A synthase [Acidiphilium sp. 37-64-53]OZB27047.1 MAG: heme A synthase [Acidiphilium sp. 34-64-41]HQT85787.1 COX15/CtaA family protein [Acidiphilium rubrum]
MASQSVADFTIPAHRADRAASVQNRRIVATWLFISFALIVEMFGIGAYVQNDNAGLSIMAWQPVSGIIPPLTHAAWERMFALYKTIPQYQLLNSHMDLAGFKAIFWPEWIHRMWGRLLGLDFGVPLVWFWWTGRLERRLRPWLVTLFVLGGVQGLIGWWMVASGFQPGLTEVSVWRLSIHYCFATMLAIAVFTTGLVVLKPDSERLAPSIAAKYKVARGFALASIAVIIVAIIAGTFLSGTHAYTVDNTFPLMQGQWVPPDYAALHPFWSNLFLNKAATQWDHRLLGTIAAVVVLAAVVVAIRADLPPRARDAFLIMGGLLVIQYILGVTTLVSKILDIGIVHQLNAVLLLAAAVWAWFELRGRCAA